jgi:hypothetical protein
MASKVSLPSLQKSVTYTYIFIQSTALPVVLYGCETWFLTLREKHKLKVFENRVLRELFGPKRDEVTGVEKTT